MNIQVLAMLCSIWTSPAACDRSNATDIIPLGTAESYTSCMLGGQMTLAQLALRADDETAWIIKCEPPTSIGREHVG